MTRFYRTLLLLLPRDLRREYGRDMEQLFRDRLRDAGSSRRARASLAIAAAVDVVSQAASERAVRLRDGVMDFSREGMTMDGWMNDVRFGLRTLSRRPGFTLTAVLTLALGIGAAVSIFTVVHGVLLRPLPFPDSDALFIVEGRSTVRGTTSQTVDHPDLRMWQDQIPGIRLAGYSGTRPTLTGFGEPRVIEGVRVTDGLMGVMGVEPVLGRDIHRSDDVVDGPRVVVISHQFWTREFAQSSDVLGRTITLASQPWEIVGVAPPGFDYPDGSELWMPRRHDTDGCGHGCRIMLSVGRLEPGTDFAATQERFLAVSDRLAEDHPDAHRDERAHLRRLIDVEVADVRAGLWVLLGAVVMVLLIACANVANLMLVRAGARHGEVAVRATLGASRSRIVTQLLIESGLVAVASGVIGLGLAIWGTDVLLSLAPESLPRIDEVGVDVTVVLVAGFLVLAVTGLFGALPALQLSRASLAERATGLRQTGRTSRLRSLLLVGEVALSLSLLLGAGLLLRTLSEARSVDLGFATTGVERFRMSIPDSRYDSLAVPRFYEELERALNELPEVAAAGFAFGAPISSGNISSSFRILDRPVDEADLPSIPLRLVTPGYLEASGQTLLQGRWFDFSDRRDAQPVAVINQAAVERFFPDTDPIGKQIAMDVSWGFWDDPPRTIVGIVSDVRARGPTSAPRPAAYFPNAQFSANVAWATLALAPGVETAIPSARRVIAALDPELAITSAHRMEDVVAAEMAPTRFYFTLLSVFSALAMILAAVGLYGVVAYLVTRRTREIGIRIALGATSDDVMKLVMSEGARPAAIGIVLGLAASFAGGGVLRSLLFGVSPYDPMTVAGATLTLAVVSVAATMLPAGRASRIAPASALREE